MTMNYKTFLIHFIWIKYTVYTKKYKKENLLLVFNCKYEADMLQAACV